MCGHSLEVNVTTNLDFFLSVTQVQLLQQLVQANVVGLEPSSSTPEVEFSLICSWFGFFCFLVGFFFLGFCVVWWLFFFLLDYHSSAQVFASSRQNYIGKLKTCLIGFGGFFDQL